MPRGKQSWIRNGQKKQQGQSDTAQLIEIKRHLKDKHKILAMKEPYLVFDIENDKLIKGPVKDISKSDLWGISKEYDEDNDIWFEMEVKIAYPRNPDLMWIDKYGYWILEVDGAVHDRKVEKTRKRNELFISNHIKLIVVNLADIKELGLNIYDYIDDQILEHIRK